MPTVTVDQPTLDRLRRLAAARQSTLSETAAACVARAVGVAPAGDEPIPHWVNDSRDATYGPPDPPDPESAPDLPGPGRPMEEWLDAFAARHEPVFTSVDDSRETIYGLRNGADACEAGGDDR